VTVVLLGAACASGAPSTRPTAPLPAPGPGLDPGRVEPAHEVVVRYPRSGAGIARYAFARRDSVVATMPSGEDQVQVLGRTAYLTLTWVAADSGAKITATVDSVVADTGLLLPAAQSDSALGTRWTGLRPPTGGLSGLTGTRTSLLGDQVRDQLALLFPRLPADGARPGGGWTDSTETPARVSAFEALERSVTASEAGQPLTSGALPIQVTSTRSAAGKATQFGQDITITATGSDTLAYQLAADGRVLAAEGRRWTSLVVELSAIGQSVPAHEMSSLSMTLLR
jgi:hypothetical protein